MYWPCSIRWSGRTPNECYLSSGWKTFVKDNLLVEGDSIKLAVDREYGKIIHVTKL